MIHWTPSEDEFLRTAWTVERMTGVEIAACLPGRSRNAVIGRIHRLGIAGDKPRPVKTPGQPRPRRSTNPPNYWTAEEDRQLRDMYAAGRNMHDVAAAMGRTYQACRFRSYKLGIRLQERRRYRPRRQTSSATGPRPESKNLPLEELARNQCRFMEGDPRDPAAGFCGHEVIEGKSWCPHHYAIVFRPIEERVREPASA